jgi:hypothetical protein
MESRTGFREEPMNGAIVSGTRATDTVLRGCQLAVAPIYYLRGLYVPLECPVVCSV